MTKIRLAVAAALVAGSFVPAVAHAGTFCRPWIEVDNSTTPPTVEYKGTLCY